MTRLTSKQDVMRRYLRKLAANSIDCHHRSCVHGESIFYLPSNITFPQHDLISPSWFFLSKYSVHPDMTRKRHYSMNHTLLQKQSQNDHQKKKKNVEDYHDRVQTSFVDKGVFHVQLSRPNKMNSLDLPMFEAIGQTIAQIREDSSIRVVILSGRGKAFCTGLDIQSLIPDIKNPQNIMKHMERLLERPSGYEREGKDSKKRGKKALGNLAQDVAYLWRDLDVPVISVLHGMCFGGGMQIALGADIRYSSPTCKLSLMEAKWGLVPDMSASITLRELIPIDIAKELTITGRTFSGIEAKEMGLVTRVSDDPMTLALDTAKEIVERSPDSVMGCKRLFQECWTEGDEDVCLKKETDIQRELLGGYNMMIASGKNFGIDLVPYKKRKEFEFNGAEFYGKNNSH